MSTLTIVLPEISDDEVSDGLRTLTLAAQKALPDQDRFYGLGGEGGYGVNYENDVFMMHRFCWCSGGGFSRRGGGGSGWRAGRGGGRATAGGQQREQQAHQQSRSQ